MTTTRLPILALLAGFVLAAIPSRAVAADAKPAGGPKLTYDDHVRPILREHCFTCHNQSMAKGGLVMESYAKLMAGGASGEVVIAGSPNDSRLFALVSHTDTPY